MNVLIALWIVLSAGPAPTSASAGSGVDGTLLIVSPADDAVTMIDAATGEEIKSRRTGKVPHEVAVSPDGRLAAVGNFGKRREPGRTLTIVDLTTHRLVREVDLGEYAHPQALTWLPDGRIAVLTQKTGHLVLVDPDGERPLASIATPWDFPEGLAITPDGGKAFVTHLGSDSVAVLDLATGKVLKQIETGSGPDGIVVTAGGKEVWVTNRAADRIEIIDVARLEIVATIPCRGFPIRLAAVPGGGRVLVSCSRSHEVAAFDVATRAEVGRQRIDLTKVPVWASRAADNPFGATPVPMTIVVTPDGKTAFVAADLADAVLSLDASTLEVTGILGSGRKPDGIAFSTVGAVRGP